jgi:FAD synthetase
MNERNFDLFLENSNSVKLSNKVKFVYFSRKDSFPEEEEFVINIAQEENVELKIMYTDYRSGLFYLVSRGELTSIALGVRKDDYTHGETNTSKSIELTDIVQVSDHNYPPFYRLYPIYNFNYHEIWGLILLCKSKYPVLYDQGFSSFGRKSNSKKNPDLFDEISNSYLPSYCLKSVKTEREFRK